MSGWKVDRNFIAATAALLGATTLAGCLAGPSNTDIRVPPLSRKTLEGGTSQGIGSRGPGHQIVHVTLVEADSTITMPVAWVRPKDPQTGGAQSFHLDGAAGGTFTFGRYRLEFPPGAVRGDGVVTISVPDPSVVGCDLSISPPSLNGFDRPVLLTVKCHQTDLSDSGVTAIHSLAPAAKAGQAAALGAGRASTRSQGVPAEPVVKPLTGIYWDSSEGWIWMGGVIDTVSWEVSAPLKHFSTYRAGW